MNSARFLGELLGSWLPDPEYAAVEVRHLAFDSRQVTDSTLFFAYPGIEGDGRQFIEQAVAAGASAVVCEKGWDLEGLDTTIPVIPLHDVRAKIGVVADRFFDCPSEGLFIVGITGTNGKTSCAHMLVQSFAALGVNSGLIGTLGWGFADELQVNPLTTPDPISLHHMLKQLKDKGATHVCMEVSSHALAQGRVSGVSFDAALFTNLTHDHLDYHVGFEEYAGAKARLFDCETLRFAVINKDDEFGRKLVDSTAAPVWTYGLEQGDVRTRRIETGIDGLKLTFATRAGQIDARPKLIGRINTHNLLAVVAVLLADGTTSSMVAAAINRLHPVPGRMELFQRGRTAPSVVVDYAHTPDALERALLSVREHCSGRLWCVFGCGGDRDRTKRPLMGTIAERLADVVIVTDDNPRHEQPQSITDEIVTGMARNPRVMNDRTAAIQSAISHADTDDWILIAGKGHETTQQVGDEFLLMDDRSTVSRCLGVTA